MRRVFMAVAAAAVLVGATGATAQAQTLRFTATLTGGNETPIILTGAFGNASVTLDVATSTVTWSIDVFNLPSGINNAHFHVGPVGIAGPTVVNIPFTANQSNDFNLSGSATVGTNLFNARGDQGIRSWDDFIQSLQGGQVYLNVHTNVNGGGEIRGQVLRAP
jgi:hypothetical protein